MTISKKLSALFLMSIASTSSFVYANKKSTSTDRAEYTSKIAIIVNKDSITEHDINDRIKLVMFTSGIKDSSAQAQLRAQVINSLVDERLQLQKAKEHKVLISDAEVDKQIENIAKENNKTVSEMTALFKANGVNIQSLRTRLRAQMSWVRLIREAFGHTVIVSQKEIDQALERLKSDTIKPQYDFLEIVLRIDNANNEAAVKQEAQKIYQQLKSGANFKAMARQFSQSQTAQNGGDVKNTTGGQLDGELETALSALKVGELSQPIKTARGYVIVKLRERKSAGATKGETLMSFKAALIPLDETPTEEQQQTIATHLELLKEKKNCKSFEAEAKSLGYTIQPMEKMPLSQLPDAFQDLVKDAKVNDILQPVREQQGLRVMMVCSKEFKAYTPPTPEEIKSALEQEKFTKISQRESNKLRSVAFIDRKDSK